MTDGEKILILFNPSAGGGRAMKRKSQLEGSLRRAGLFFELVVTENEAQLRELTAAAARIGRTTVGAGGDSTFHIMANEIMNAGGRSALGLVGMGSSNDIALEFGLGTVDEACRAIKSGRQKAIDLGRIRVEGQEPVYFLGQANIGLGVFVNRYVARLAGKKPRWVRWQTAAGVMGIVNAYRTRKIPVRLKIVSGESTRQGSYVLAVFSNVRYWATGKIMCPEARPDDGRLDACLFQECSFSRLARLNSLANRGRHGGCPEVDLFQSQAFEVTADEPFLIQTDGEILAGPSGPLALRRARFEAVPSALRLIA